MDNHVHKPRFYLASDYCGIDSNGGAFYYGYEYSICEVCGQKNRGEYCDDHPEADREWCFVANLNGKETVIKFSDLGCKDMFDVVECLGVGIGHILMTHNLTLKESNNG